MAVCGAWPVLPGAGYGNIYLGYVRELRREHANIRLAYVDRLMRKHAKRISRAAGGNRGVEMMIDGRRMPIPKVQGTRLIRNSW
jgi:hypothetical protein